MQDLYSSKVISVHMQLVKSCVRKLGAKGILDEDRASSGCPAYVFLSRTAAADGFCGYHSRTISGN